MPADVSLMSLSPVMTLLELHRSFSIDTDFYRSFSADEALFFSDGSKLYTGVFTDIIAPYILLSRMWSSLGI